MNTFDLKQTLSRAFLCFFVLLPFALLQAQSKAEKEVASKKLFRLGKEYIRVEEFHHAEDIFKELIKREPENPDYNYFLGVSLLSSTEEAKYLSLEHFKIAQKKKHYDRLYFYLARAFHYHHQFDSAISYYEKHLSEGSKFEYEDHPEEIKRMIKQCQVGKEMVNKPIPVKIFNLGDQVNSEMPEIAPAISADETRLIFTSRRKDSMGKELDPLLNMPYEDIYIVEKDDKGNWGKPTNIGPAINTQYHDASIGLSPDGMELFIYKDEDSSGAYASGSIYVSYYKNGKWTAPEKLPQGVNSNDRETHASITADDKILLFTSNRDQEGAQGGEDIYMVRKLPNGQWAQPLNLGEQINTPYDEESPFIHPNGKILYFSSEGHDSMGGFDIFYSEWDEEKNTWGKPSNLGYPINTADDDIFYTVSADGMRGYFTSIRADTRGAHDIYMVDYPSKEVKIIVLKGKVTDAATGKPLDATIEVVDNQTGQFVAVGNSNSINGRYSMFLEPEKNYGVRVWRNGYLFKSLNIDVPEQFEVLELNEDFSLQNLGDQKLEELNNVFFSSSSDLLVTSDPELAHLKKLLEENPEYVVEIAVHADNMQDSLVSVFTTQAQADAIVMELKRLGTTEGRIVGKGYGFGYNYPVTTNMTTQGRLKNERTEYIIRKNKEKLEDIAYEEVNEVFKDTEAFKDFQCPAMGDIIEPKEEVDLHKAENEITKSSASALDEIAVIMDRCKDLKVEAGSYTDDSGSAEYSLERTKKRALILKQQLVYRGIAADRIFAKGYGATSPVASNSTPEGRARNNRIVFKVVEGKGDLIPAPLIAKKGENLTAAQVASKTAEILFRKGEKLNDIVYFEFDSDELTERAIEVLDKLVVLLKNNKKVKLLIGGFTDARGSDEYNKKLGARRAESVMSYLKIKGIDTNRFDLKSFGESKSTTKETEDKNKLSTDRKVEFQVLEEVVKEN